MKIAIMTSSFPLDAADPASAAGLFVRDFALALSRLDVEVHVLTQDKGLGSRNQPSELHVHCFPWRGNTKALSQLKIYNPRDLAASWSLIRNGKRSITQLHREFKFDHSLAMWAVPGGLFARHLNRVAGVPYSVWCLGSDIWTYGKIPIVSGIVGRIVRSAIYRFADGIELAEDAKQLSGKEVQFLPSSRRLKREFISPARLSSEGPNFLFVGRYAKVKGIDILLDAWAQFRKKENCGHLYLFGGGPAKAELGKQIDALCLNDYVSLGGYANAETYISHALACDAMMIPSRTESIPVVLSDAVQLGKPVIVSDVGDMGELVRSTQAGIVVKPESSDQLSRAMQDMLERGFGTFRTGVTKLAAQFDIDRTARKFLEQIRQPCR